MLTKESLQLLEALFDKKLEPIKENIEITRKAVNYLVEWVERIEKMDTLKFRMPG